MDANDLSDQFLNRTPEAPGAFKRDDVYYRVQMNKTSGRPYAKVLRDGRFDYVAGAIYNVRENDRLSMDEAVAISAQIGECIVCGRTLTDPKSVVKGIGPVCRKRLADYRASDADVTLDQDAR